MLSYIFYTLICPNHFLFAYDSEVEVVITSEVYLAYRNLWIIFYYSCGIIPFLWLFLMNIFHFKGHLQSYLFLFYLRLISNEFLRLIDLTIRNINSSFLKFLLLLYFVSICYCFLKQLFLPYDIEL